MSRQDRIIALIRTAVPALVGALLAFIVAHIPFIAVVIASVDHTLAAAGFAGVSVSVILQAVVVALIIALYYWVARLIGRRWPKSEKWLLGHAGSPTYAPVVQFTHVTTNASVPPPPKPGTS